MFKKNEFESQRHLDVKSVSRQADTEVTINDDIKNDIYLNLENENKGRKVPRKLTPLMGQNKGGIQVDSTKKTTYSGPTPLMPNPLNQSTGCFLMGRGGGGRIPIKEGGPRECRNPSKM